VRRIGVDEKAAAKGHRYLPLVGDLDAGTVEPIAEDRAQESLDGYYAGLTKEQLEGIEAVAMDRWEPDIQATWVQVPAAAEKMVFDRFHVMGHVGKAVDTVRKHEHRELMEWGDETLKGSKYLWLSSRENVPERRRDAFATLRRQGAQGGMGVGHQRGATPSVALRLPSIRLEVLETVVLLGHAQPAGTDSQGGGDDLPAHRQHRDSYQHPVTNAMSEGLNSQIQKITSMACGFRNTEHFKTAIYFRFGGLDLDPC
jgi:transposase